MDHGAGVVSTVQWQRLYLLVLVSEPSYSFPQWLHHLTFSPEIQNSNFSKSWPTFAIFCFSDSSHPMGHEEVLSHRGFNLKLPNE